MTQREHKPRIGKHALDHRHFVKVERMLVDDQRVGPEISRVGHPLEVQVAAALERRLVKRSKGLGPAKRGFHLGQKRLFLKHDNARLTHQNSVEQGRARPWEPNQEDGRCAPIGGGRRRPIADPGGFGQRHVTLEHFAVLRCPGFGFARIVEPIFVHRGKFSESLVMLTEAIEHDAAQMMLAARNDDVAGCFERGKGCVKVICALEQQ